MISALFKAFAQLSDPRMRRVLRIGILSALACWATLAVVAALVVKHTHFFDESWADAGTGFALGAIGVVVPVLFFSALSTFVMSFFLEDIAEVVESRHYPDLGPSRRPGWREILASSTRFLVVMVAVTMLAAPVYLALLFFGLGLILNYLVNGYLLGREYYELVAGRRLTPDQVRAQLHLHFTKLWLSGAVINFLFQVPLLNLAAPVLGTAFMVHVAQSLPPAPPPEQVPA